MWVSNKISDSLKTLLTKVKLVLEEIEYEIFRKIVVVEKTRADGRETFRSGNCDIFHIIITVLSVFVHISCLV